LESSQHPVIKILLLSIYRYDLARFDRSCSSEIA
jgi:hypothetical protein